MTVNQVLGQTDWALLAEQKAALLEVIAYTGAPIDGLLNWLDALMDAAEREGFPVVFLTEDEGGTA